MFNLKYRAKPAILPVNQTTAKVLVNARRQTCVGQLWFPEHLGSDAKTSNGEQRFVSLLCHSCVVSLRVYSCAR
jgi:hypothetical protein